MNEYIPLSVPHIAGREWEYIKECLDTGWISSVGSYVERFEKSVCDFTGAKHAVACVNGTSALHVSLILAGVKEDEEVIVPTLTFISSINVIKYVRAIPVFMDCDEYYNIDILKTIDFIETQTYIKNGFTYNKRTDRRIAAVLPVHVLGNAADIEVLLRVCKEKNITIVEDAAESFGTYYREGILSGRHTGTIGDIGCYSFNGNKIITCGGGGMIVTNNSQYAQRARYLSTQAKDDPVHYIHNETGFNYRLTNIQAALGVAQMEQLQNIIKIRKKNYYLYKEALSDIDGLKLANVPPYASNNFWMYALQIENDLYGESRDELMNRFAEKEIQTRPVWSLNHLQKPFKDSQAYRIENAVQLHEKTLCIPCSSDLKQEDIERVISVLSGGAG